MLQIRNKKWLIAIVIILSLFIYIKFGHPSNYVLVKTTPLKQGELIASITATGKIKPSKEINIRAQTEGVIDKILVKEGDKIVKNKEIIYLDSSTGQITIKSPISGIVLLKPDSTEIGGTTTPGQLLLTIGNIDTLIVKADVNEIEAKDLITGQQVKITSDAYVGEVWQGTIKSIAPEVHDVDGTSKVPVEVIIRSSSPFKPGNRVSIEIITADKTGIYYVPLEAIIDRDGKKYVYVVKENKAVEMPVETGISNMNYVEILSPGHVNSNVIISNNSMIKDGCAVKEY